MKKNIYTQHQSGFIAFTSLLVVAAVVFTIAISLPLLGISEANTSLGFAKSAGARTIAEGCAEEALLRLRDSVSYTGGNLALGDGTCTIAVSGSGANKTIDVTATVSVPPDYVKKLQITVKRVGNSINLLSWQEVE